MNVFSFFASNPPLISSKEPPQDSFYHRLTRVAQNAIRSFSEISLQYLLGKMFPYRLLFRELGIPIVSEVPPLSLIPREGACELLPTAHSAETEIWRERMIQSAEENVLISGNYCGGEALFRLFFAIEQRIVERPQLTVILISSPNFLTQAHRSRIQELENRFPENFTIVESPDSLHICAKTGIKFITNHTKVCVIDYGRMFLFGGSGIRDNFSTPGLEDETREEYRARVLGEPPPPQRRAGQKAPPSFRDQDFVGLSEVGPHTIGTQTYINALWLAYRYVKTYAAHSEIKEIPIPIARLMRTPVPEALEYPVLPVFVQDPRRCLAQAKVLVQEAQNRESFFARELIQAINSATDRIWIDHMFFHPSSSVFSALVAAAERGISITLITNGLHKNAPAGNIKFAARNRYNYISLIRSVSREARNRIQIYEFRQKKMGIHKKVIVIDDRVITGSSNLGLKSLLFVCDYEFNFSIRSRDFANRTIEVLREDISHSSRISRFNTQHRIAALKQRLLAPLID